MIPTHSKAKTSDQQGKCFLALPSIPLGLFLPENIVLCVLT